MELFKVFGIEPVRLSLDLGELEAAFHRLSLQWHPDRNPGSLEAIEKSSLINRAYRVLREPWERALYILGPEALASSSKVPPNLAELYFELQEADDHARLQELAEHLKAARTERDLKLKQLFADFDAFPERRSFIMTSLRDLVLENKYARSMLNDLEKRNLSHS